MIFEARWKAWTNDDDRNPRTEYSSSRRSFEKVSLDLDRRYLSFGANVPKKGRAERTISDSMPVSSEFELKGQTAGFRPTVA